MQKMSPVASKLSELWQFLYTKVSWKLNFTKFLNLEISLNFRDRGPIFCMWALNLHLNNMSIATWGLSPLRHWFLRGGFRSLPPPTHRSCTPSEVGLKWLRFSFNGKMSKQGNTGQKWSISETLTKQYWRLGILVVHPFTQTFKEK